MIEKVYRCYTCGSVSTIKRDRCSRCTDEAINMFMILIDNLRRGCIDLKDLTHRQTTKIAEIIRPEIYNEFGKEKEKCLNANI
jgi:hypothetical protein